MSFGTDSQPELVNVKVVFMGHPLGLCENPAEVSKLAIAPHESDRAVLADDFCEIGIFC